MPQPTSEKAASQKALGGGSGMSHSVAANTPTPTVSPRTMSYAQMITGDWIASREQVEARKEVDKSEMF